MKASLAVVLAGASLAAALHAQPPQNPLPKGQMPDLGRPTKVGRSSCRCFNFDEYFPGKWTFEWDVPEGPLGPAGRITGTTMYKPVDGRVLRGRRPTPLVPAARSRSAS